MPVSEALNLRLLQGDWTCNLTCRCCVKVTKSSFTFVITSGQLDSCMYVLLILLWNGNAALRFLPVERIFWCRSCSFWRRCCRRAWWLMLTLVSMATDRGTGPRSCVDKPCMTADTPPLSTCFSWSPKAAWDVIERYYFDYLSWLDKRLQEKDSYVNLSSVNLKNDE